MSGEEEGQTFNDEPRAIFGQPSGAPVKTRPRTPGARATTASELPRRKTEASEDGGIRLTKPEAAVARHD
jgi:hypothetical protein